MRAFSRYLLAAAVLALIGGVLLALGNLDRKMVRAQQSFAGINSDDPQTTLDTAERYFEYASHVPWIGNRPVNEVRARKAELEYWRKQYGSIIPKQTNPLDGVAADNIDLQMVVANAVYRDGVARSKDRQITMDSVNGGIAAYLAVLKNAGRQEEAAYNYEYLVRVREELRKGHRESSGAVDLDGPLGHHGGPPVKSTDDLKIYVPLQEEERERNLGSGKGVPAKRRG